MIPLIADGVKKTAKNGSSGFNFAGVHRELFWKATDKEVKVLTEVKGNTKTLAMVLRSERELLSLNKDQESQRLSTGVFDSIRSI